jgi:hypothetical protein
MVLFELLQKVAEVFEGNQIQYLVTGAIASVAYGEPRLTNDIDIVAAMKEEHVPGLLKAFPSDEFYVSEEAMKEAIRHQGQFNIIHPSSGLKVDVIIRKDTEFDRSRFSRIRRIQPAESYQANFASPEDVIIKKMEYYREGGSEKHLRDITGILKVSGEEIDCAYIDHWARRLDLIEIWEAIQERLREGH